MFWDSLKMTGKKTTSVVSMTTCWREENISVEEIKALPFFLSLHKEEFAFYFCSVFISILKLSKIF